MAQQWQLRRGTTTQHNSFTGAVGEVTVDTTTHALKVHDGVKQGGYTVDTVVGFQVPTSANNYTWYRKYASGWVEQGGWGTCGASGFNITLPVTMANANYIILAHMIRNDTAAETGGDVMPRIYNQTASYFGFHMKVFSGATDQGNRNYCWEVKGMAA